MNENSRFFSETLMSRDPVIASEIALEFRRQQAQIELIASENLVSAAVLEAQGTVLSNKYAAGYPANRHYAACEHVDRVEALAIDRCRALFDAEHANVQPHSGAQANAAVLHALLAPGDTILVMSQLVDGLPAHGSGLGVIGSGFHVVNYGVEPDTCRIDYQQVQRLAVEHRPQLIIAGYAAYPFGLDFAAFRDIADSVGALLLVDMAHMAGLVAAGKHPNPLRFADVVTATTHMTLRGPRGGVVLTRHAEIAGKVDAAVSPGLQGAPLMHVLAGKAVAFGEALRPEFLAYIDQVLRNAQALGKVLQSGGLRLFGNGTENHQLLLDLRGKDITGLQAEKALERAGITCNRICMPADAGRLLQAAGIQLGTAAGTSRGFGTAQFEEIGVMILEVLSALSHSPEGDEQVERAIRSRVKDMCSRFPFYSHLDLHI